MKTCFYHRAKSDNKRSLEEQKELVRRCAEDDGFIVRDDTDCGDAEPSECPMLMKMKKTLHSGQGEVLSVIASSTVHDDEGTGDLH